MKIKSIITTNLSPFSDIRHAVLVSSNYSVLLISLANRNLGAAKPDTHGKIASCEKSIDFLGFLVSEYFQKLMSDVGSLTR